MNKKFVYSLCLLIIAVGVVLGINNYKSTATIQKNKVADYRYLIEINGKYGYINRWGKEVIPPKFDSGNDFSEGLAAVCKNGKCGYINKAGKVIIPLKFDDTDNFSEGLAIIESNGLYGFINNKGNIIIKPQFSYYPEDFSEGLAAVCKEDKNKTRCGYINKKGHFQIYPNYDTADNFNSGLALVTTNNGKCYFIKHNGEKVLNSDCINSYKDELNVKSIYSPNEAKCVVANKNGKIIFDPSMKKLSASLEDGECSYFSEELLAVRSDQQKWGFVDKKGNIIIKPVFDKVDPFSEGLARIYINNKIGFINKLGKFVIKPTLISGYNKEIEYIDSFNHSKGFKNGLSVFLGNQGYGYIDKTGKFVWFINYK